MLSWPARSASNCNHEQRDRSGLAIEPDADDVPSRIRPTIGSGASERAFQASQSLLILRQTRLTMSLLTAPRNSAANARRTRRVLVPARYALAISASAVSVRR